MNKKIEDIVSEVKKVVIGKDEIIEKVLMAILAGGHILLEDVPGVGKTTLALTFSKVLGLDYKRMQFTPDSVPSDITGFSVYNKNSGEFQYMEGCAMTNLLLADEINRASSKTQSALLEVMEEGKITVDGVTRTVEKPFVVIATQNPTGWIGTQSLPNSQLDRFMIRLNMGYPDMNNLIEIMKDRHHENPLDKVKHVINKNELINLQELAENIYVSDEIYEYISKLVEKTREHELIKLGISPRGALAICKMAKAKAMLGGRDYVVPQDVQYIFKDVCSHRIIVESRSMINEVNTDEIMKEIIESVENE